MITKKDNALDEIRQDFEVLSGVILKQMELLSRLVSESGGKETKLSICKDIFHNEVIVDTFELKISERVINSIVLYSPVAGELRQVISCYRIISNLERISDQATNICQHYKKSDNIEVWNSFSEIINEMIVLTSAMVRNAISSFLRESSEYAILTIDGDDQVDDLNRRVNDLIMERITDTNLREEVNSFICLNNISHNIERIADNATNIAEASIYMLQGKDIRHARNYGADEVDLSAK